MRPIKSLKIQFLLVYIAIMLLFSAILSTYVYVQNRNYTREALTGSFKNTAAFLANDIESELDTICSYSYILSRNPSLIQMLLNPYDIYDTVVALNSQIEPTIQFILSANDRIKNITIYVDERDRKIPSGFFEDVATVKNTVWYQTVPDLDGSHVFTDDKQIYIITPIRNYHSQRIDTGYIKTVVDIEKLSENALTKHKDLHFTLSEESGEILFSTLETPVPGNYLALGQYDLRSTPASISFYLDRSLIHFPSWNLLLPVIFVLVISLLLSCIFMRYMNNKMFKRLQRIKEQVANIDAEHFVIAIDDHFDDEIGALSTCINKMSLKISNMFSELEAAKNREQKAEVEALRARIDPHFLYNIMNTINWIALDGNTDQICAITHELAVYYRTTLNNGRTTSTINSEIENVRAYLNLQKIASNNAFDVVYQIDRTLLNCETCDFILQPLAENALTHGIKPLKGRRGTITVALFQQNDMVCMSVTDNGVGLNNSIAKASSLKRAHYGIENINLRISLTFGKQYGISLEPGPDAIGTVATIRLPKQLPVDN